MEKEDLAQLKIARGADPSAPYRRSGKKRWIWILLILAMLFLVGFLYSQGWLRPAQEVSVTTVSLVYPSQPNTLLNAVVFQIKWAKDF
jgi:hypothetical protein